MKYEEHKEDVCYVGYCKQDGHNYIFIENEGGSGGCIFSSLTGVTGYSGGGHFSYVKEMELATPEQEAHLRACMKVGTYIYPLEKILEKYQIY